MSSSAPPSPLTPEQTQRLAMMLRSSSIASPTPDGPPPPAVLTPQQLLRSATNKAAAHRIRASQQLVLAARASVVAAAVGTGVDEAASKAAARDLEVLMQARKLRAPAEASEGGVVKGEPDGHALGSPTVSVTTVEEGVLWIVESLKFVLHPDSAVNTALYTCAIRAGERAARMHDDHGFMSDFEAEAVQRYSRLDTLKYPTIPGGTIPKAEPLDMLCDALSRSGYIDYWKGVVRHLLGVSRLLRNTANDHLQQLFGVEVQNRNGDKRGESWYEEFLVRDACLTRKQVRLFLQ